MFSDALLNALHQGHYALGSKMSVSELGDLVIENLKRNYPDNWVRPEVHSPDMREGNLAVMPFFPNTKFKCRAPEAEKIHLQAEAERSAREAATRNEESERTRDTEELRVQDETESAESKWPRSEEHALNAISSERHQETQSHTESSTRDISPHHNSTLLSTPPVIVIQTAGSSETARSWDIDWLGFLVHSVVTSIPWFVAFVISYMFAPLVTTSVYTGARSTMAAFFTDKPGITFTSGVIVIFVIAIVTRMIDDKVLRVSSSEYLWASVLSISAALVMAGTWAFMLSKAPPIFGFWGGIFFVRIGFTLPALMLILMDLGDEISFADRNQKRFVK